MAAKFVMNNIPPDLIINWDQTGLKIVPTGEWTMNLAGEKVISIVGSDDKQEITAVLVGTRIVKSICHLNFCIKV